MINIYSKTFFIVEQKRVSKALNIILINSLSYIKTDFLKNGDLKITIFLKNKEKFEKCFNENNFDIKFKKEIGLIAKLKQNKHRIGFLIGFMFLLSSAFISSKFVWTINVYGNETLNENEVISELNNVNFHIGSFIPFVDYKELHNEILLNSDKISWISVNISGSVANVFVKEKFKEISKEEIKFSNVVSKYDGQIISINVIDGEKQVSIGDVVKKGDLLISGVIDSQSQGVRYENAKGEIKAYVNKEIEIKIPYNTYEKHYTGKVYEDKQYIIFNNFLNFYKKYSNYGTFCDTIEKIEQITVFDTIKLPIYKKTVKYYEYEYNDVTYTKSQAVDIAFIKLRYEMDKELKTAELISKSISTSYDNEFIYISANLYCIEEIGINVDYDMKN